MWLTLLTGDRPLLYKMIKTIQHIQCCFPMYLTVCLDSWLSQARACQVRSKSSGPQLG